MQKLGNNMLTDISAELDREFGTPGAPEREKFDEEAYAFYTGQTNHRYINKERAGGYSSALSLFIYLLFG